MSPEVSRACARLKNELNLGPGPELDRLVEAAENAPTLQALPGWVKTGLRNIGEM